MTRLLALLFIAISLLPTAGCSDQRKETATAQTQLSSLATAIEAYESDNGIYPPNLKSLGGNPPSVASYVKAQEWLLDPWNTLYSYSASSNGYDLRSAGPDRKIGSPDDITLKKRIPNGTKPTR